MPNITDSLIQGFSQVWYLPLILIVFGLIKIYLLRLEKNFKQKRKIEKHIKEVELGRENELKKIQAKNQNIEDMEKRQREFEQNRKERYKKYLETASNKGKEYEEFVAGYFKIDGYEVNSHGIKKGKKDKGIDIICTKDEELILIQCKNWKEDSKYKINHEKLKAFVGCCTEYVNENKLFDKNIKLKFITSNYILDESGKKFLQESKTLQYEILKY